MAYTLTYSDLPENIQYWQGLPLSLNGCEVVPLDYNAGKTGWIIYGKKLNKTLLSKFQRQLAMPMVVVSSWKIKTYQIVRIAGVMPKKAKSISLSLGIDVAPIDNLPTLHSPGLLVMDMDSTAIGIECIDELAKLQGVGEQVAAVTELAMRGELDFASSLRKRVATLTGAPQDILEQVKKTLPLTPGLTCLVKELHKKNWHVAIVSGGFTYFADHLKQKLKLVAAHANELEIKKGQLTGKVIGQIVDAKYKARMLQQLAASLDIPIEQTVAIGDGANDLMMIRIAGLGVAYHGKPKVVEKAKISINYADLTGLWCILSTSLLSEG
ncbi:MULTISPECIES: phosphoserine phosphatase [Gilliamella]|uniref:Phosphoserine phosphatase n=1 Tax=Gilliamella apis TaxID=1970738 RepID=A0A2V4DR41_9GAMM|nr:MULTISPECIES: phosphoserine phosphatase [Gilliamella]MBI0104774.1 phosphoserine phosphatase [Gilliamella sp. W8145]MBI0157076.1 phosphoserine phosphatase [Gilliamella sp. M0364]OTQ56728.1 phosphoserine phosphatase SerB [Gilliamella apis]PXY90101.1 phosphoserine phosphatase [Gilliamella apis]WLS94485.1 phosphoserine phosphatase [Gilliamella apis]